MIHTQRDSHESNDRHYAYCRCGVVSPLRREHEAAEADETAHESVCSASLRRWAAIQMLKAIACGLAVGLAVCLVILLIAAITGGVRWT